MKLSIIIVSYNTAEMTVQTVQSVLASLSQVKWSKQVEIVVVDNDSHDDTIKKLRQIKDKRLKVYNTGANLGFGRGNNYGLARSSGELVLFLNSDTVVREGAIEKLVDYYQQHHRQPVELGLLAAQLLNPDGSYQPQGGDLPTLWSVAGTMLGLDDVPIVGKYLPAVQHTGKRFEVNEVETTEWLEKGWVGGTAVLTARKLLEQFGDWDEQIFMYGEDQELCYRWRRLGFHHGILTTAQIVHYGSVSAGSKNAVLGEIKGYFYFWRKYQPDWQLAVLGWILTVAMWERVMVYRWLKRDKKRAEIYQAAMAEVKKQRQESRN